LIRRTHDWRGRLTAWLSTKARAPFAYGEHDCALFAAGAIEAMTGVDPAAEWRGRYSTWRGGLRVLRAAGINDQVAAVAALLTEIPPSFAAAGDIAVVAGEGGPALGVVQGEWIYVLRPEGLALVPFESASRAFEIPAFGSPDGEAA
jgi:hypothetical protein